ncbi:MAG: 4-(cytidine 5'-diphospho)-2-C-methyl-D-erythritol kinase [Candidatus Aminicenantes bacterium]|nr:4-(cytidine 5'-diphospho)-2-C-methyl-D-erythritol kinase [Candidatus Aminicenantes bacterium]
MTTAKQLNVHKTRSFAKINLGIEILRKRQDGYHEIRTLFQTIDFYDSLEFLPLKGKSIQLEGDDPRIPWNKDNLIYKAASVLQETHGISTGVEIRVRKRIPPGKGLGGGSSNAAVTLYVLNQIWGLSLGKKQLQEIGGRLGADIPFFLDGGTCLGLGKGDKIIPLPDLEKFHCLLVLPDFPVPTADVYKRIVLTLQEKESRIIEFLNSHEFRLLENNLEETVFSLYPQLKSIKSHISERDSILTLVSGTGSAVYGLFPEKDKAEHALGGLGNNLSSLLIETLSRDRYWRGVMNGV